jgi:hypothetical protein
MEYSNIGWPIGYKFVYKSNYGGAITGIVARLEHPTNFKKVTLENYRYLDNKHLYSIYSTRGARYNLGEIEIETLSEIRDMKLKDIGI